MQIEFHSGRYSEATAAMLVFPVFEGETVRSAELGELDGRVRGVLSALLASGEFTGELHQTCTIHRPRQVRADRILLLGAGKKETVGPARWRELAGTAIRSALSGRSRNVVFYCRKGAPDQATVQAATEGALLGEYHSEIHQTKERKEKPVESFAIWSRTGAPRAQTDEGIRRGRIVADAVNLARTLVNEPSNIVTPTAFAERALESARMSGLELEVLDRQAMERLGMNTLLAVSRGSGEPPRLLVLRIPGSFAKAPVHALVGKGVTFDSGGISLKPADRMEEMKGDMAGGAAVLGAMVALAQLRPRRRVLGLVPLVENLPSGSAIKPGDVVRSHSGKTVEIINTDAEGRLILADALAYARTLGATHLIDIATLTGAIGVALGRVRAGMMGTDQKTMDRLSRLSDITGEKYWQLPLDDEYRKAIRSEIADVKNVGNRYGGAITAAKFLQEFVAETPWVHLDIAGMELCRDPLPFIAKGATGYGVRTLVHLMS